LPPVEIARVVGAQYYWIDHFHPVAVMGYIAVLEGNPPTAETIEFLRHRTGLPDGAFSTLIKHGKLDARHGREAFKFLDTLELTSDLEAAIGLSALNTLDGLTQVFGAMGRRLGGRQRRPAGVRVREPVND
jgi:hypothetical protein